MNLKQFGETGNKRTKYMNAPIIFCHYGASPYLPYVLKCAKLSNPDKRIILLGDERNKELVEECGVEHRFFEDFNNGEKIETFDRVYRLIQGKDHAHFKGGRDWVNFVFKRWFFVFNFVRQEGVESFWHFDSDTMILDRLDHHEAKFKGYDCTEQCQGICMNGYISGLDVVRGYLDKINTIFQREEYLKSQQEEFDKIHPLYAFTEMRAYEIYKTEERLKTIRLSTIIDRATFDDCIIDEDDRVMESLPYGRKVKKVYLCPDGRFYCCEKGTSLLVRMNSLNLSCVPVYIFEGVLSHQQVFVQSKTRIDPDLNRMKTLANLGAPLKVMVRTRVKRIAQRIGFIPQWAKKYNF